MSISSFAQNVICEGWYQESGSELKKIPLNIASATDKNVIYSARYSDYSYNVNWDKDLTTFYIKIERSGNYLLGTTARVPTQNHPENFTDLHLPNGPRLSVNCEMK